MAEKSWEILEGACHSCKKCRLWEMRTNVVIGKGSRNADILFIGEGPRSAGGFAGRTLCRPCGTIIG